MGEDDTSFPSSGLLHFFNRQHMIVTLPWRSSDNELDSLNEGLRRCLGYLKDSLLSESSGTKFPWKSTARGCLMSWLRLESGHT